MRRHLLASSKPWSVRIHVRCEEEWFIPEPGRAVSTCLLVEMISELRDVRGSPHREWWKRGLLAKGDFRQCLGNKKEPEDS